MKALILVGGKGTRLKPYTTVLPKPLLPVGDRPILEIILHQLSFYGFDEVILAVGHMSHLFESFFQDGSKYGIGISYSFEDKPLGTAGALAESIQDLDDDFLAPPERHRGESRDSFRFTRIEALVHALQQHLDERICLPHIHRFPVTNFRY